jgi:tetratricopeptide (TPR) repeat protein
MQVWRNGHLLGIYLSDERRYEEALVAFDASKSMYGAQPDWSDYNKAIVLNRMNRSDEAIALLEEVAARARDDHDSELARRASQFLTDLTAPSAATRRSHRRRPNARRRRHFDTLLED